MVSERFAAIVALLAACGGARGATPAPAPPPSAGDSVLARLETYTPPPLPADDVIDRETYDYRASAGQPVPRTAVDTFACDLAIVTRYNRGVAEPAESIALTREDVALVVELYLTLRWEDLPGLRPWAHASFVRGLGDAERFRLIDEAAAWLAEHPRQDC
jgi:hypothetical protein